MPIMDCPECDKYFETDKAAKIHCKLSHNKSISREKSICEVTGCENCFEYYPSEKDGVICPSCIKEGKNVIHTPRMEKEDLVTEKDTSEYISVECRNCNKRNKVPPSRVPDNGNYICSRSCLDEYNSDRMSGKSNPRYVDGKSSGKKYNSNWRAVKSRAMDRDGGCCVLCGNTENIHGHHIIPVRKFDNEDDAHYLKNAVILCAKCHRDVEYGNIDKPFEGLQAELENHSTENFKYLQ